MLISVIVTTYDWPEALEAVLYGLSRQTDRNFEVVVADDGSDARTAAVVRAAAKGMTVRHAWHKHRGFRLAEIRNRAILESRGEYCIFLDGDCVPRPSFVATHRGLAEPGYCVQGSRVMLRAKLTARIFSEKLRPGEWSLPRWWLHRFRHNVGRVSPLITLPLGSLRKRVTQTGERALGANQAIWRRDLDRIDGFDAAYVGWGWEDSDVLARLLHTGVGRKYGNYATTVIHLWHHAAFSRDNRRLLDDTLAVGRTTARRGMSALSPADEPVAATAQEVGRNQACAA